MHPEIPYMLYLNFVRPVDQKILFDILTSANLLNIGDQPIDDEFKNVIFHFKSDTTKRTMLYVGVDTKNKCCENINIAFGQGTDLNTIKKTFELLNKLDTDNIILIDQEIKNELYAKAHESFLTKQNTSIIPDCWIKESERQATLTLSFEDFYINSFKLANRDELLGK